MQSNIQGLTPNKFVQTLTIIYMALLSGLLFFMAIVFFQFDGAMTPTFDTSDTLLLVYPVIAVGAILGSQTIFKKLLASAESKPSLKAKLASYQTASIIKFAMIEGPAFFGIILSMITGNTAFMAIAGVLVLFLMLQRPSKTKVESDLKLRGDHRNQFNTYDEVID
ncbi:hypothetical protein [Kordia jejudonensis]|uniref:hypothetical protein n=1 Tax=Kordia jejudonensis TaxID=1348245 RepID=UPI000629802F|nr:hypothetical protein [Kordia jejudonensis]